MSFIGKVEHSFKNLFNKVPSWSQTASATLKLIAPLTGTIVGLAAGDEGSSQAAKIISEVESDLAVASSLLAESHDGAAAPAGLANALNAAKSNLQSLLAAGHIKNPATVRKIETLINTIVGEVEAIQSILPANASAASSGK